MTQKLPIGIQTFATIIEEDYLYIDKTRWIYQLLHEGRYYFLQRPRRFGKSLLISTLAAIFEGRRELFTGLWLGQSDYDFQPHPVIRLDWSSGAIFDGVGLERHVKSTVKKHAHQYDIVIESDYYTEQFTELIEKMAAHGKVVILIDEYDKPILDNITKPTERADIKERLKGFYQTIKASDEYLQFTLLTGVTKFSKISVFSGLNNLFDISLHPDYADMLGLTQTELEDYFQVEISQFAAKESLSERALLDKIKVWYDGFRFSLAEKQVYNPFSTLLLFHQQAFNFYWFESGTPTFLTDLIKEKAWYDLPDEKIVPQTAFSSYEIETLQPLPLLYQTGYLTIVEHIQSYESLYRLDFPNFEVENGFLTNLLQSFTENSGTSAYIYRLVTYLRQNQLEHLFALLREFFIHIPERIQLRQEKYYQTIFFCLFKLIGVNIQAEVMTNLGYTDAIVETSDRVYIFEFKLNGTKEAALQQIKDKQYAAKYQSGNKAITLVGVEFDKATRNIGKYLTENIT